MRIGSTRILAALSLVALFGVVGCGANDDSGVDESEDYRYYWHESWRTIPPSWLEAQKLNWPGNFKGRNWELAWQWQISGDPNSHLDRVPSPVRRPDGARPSDSSTGYHLGDSVPDLCLYSHCDGTEARVNLFGRDATI